MKDWERPGPFLVVRNWKMHLIFLHRDNGFLASSFFFRRKMNILNGVFFVLQVGHGPLKFRPQISSPPNFGPLNFDYFFIFFIYFLLFFPKNITNNFFFTFSYIREGPISSPHSTEGRSQTHDVSLHNFQVYNFQKKIFYKNIIFNFPNI